MAAQTWEDWKKENHKDFSQRGDNSGSSGVSSWEKWKNENTFASPQEKQTAMRKRYYEASGIDSLRTDFQRYSASAYSYLTQRHKPAGTVETENYQKQNAQWKHNLQNERSYFEKYAKYFSEDDLAAFNKEMDYYEKLLGSYDAVLGSDTAVEDYIAKRLSDGTEALGQAVAPEIIQTETVEEPRAIENGTVLPRDMALAAMGVAPLYKGYSALLHDSEELLSGHNRVGAEQAEAYSDRIDGVITDIKRARIFLTANKASFTDEEYRWLSAYLESAEADTGRLRETAQAYKNAAAWENPLNGRKIIFPSSQGVDVNGDGFTDTAMFGGELAASRMKQTWDEVAPKIVEEGTRKNFYFQSAQEQTDYAMEYSGELRYAAQHSDENGYYDNSGIGELSAQYLPDGSITYTDTKKGMTPMEAQARWEELNERVWYLLYAGVLDENEFEQLLTEVYTARDAYLAAFPSDGTECQREMHAAMVLTLPEDKNELMREFRYQTGITREGLWQDAYRMQATKSMPGMPDVTTDAPRRYSTEELFNSAEARFGASFYSADASYREIQDHVVLGYLANAKLTQEEYDRYMKLLDRYEAEGFYSQDIAQFRAQRERNGLRQNLSGQQAALEWYPNAGGETFGEGLVLGGEDARDFLLDTAPAAVDTALTRGVGYAAIGIGKALSWLGVDAGEGIADFGDEMTEYKNPRIEEAAQWQYNRHRQYGEKIGNEEKVWKWVYERLPALSNTLTMMGAAGVIGNTVAGTAGAASAGGSGAVTSPLAANTVRATVYNDFLAATAGIGTTAWAVKNAKLLSMAGFASIGDYAEQLGKDSTPTQRVTHALAAGAMEYMSEKLFSGNPLLDDEAGALTKLVYRLTENKTIRKIVSSAAMDWLGEGFEEVISSVGMMGVDYAMYGKSDATLGQFVDDFTMGILVAAIMLGGSKTVEAFCRADQYGQLKHITQFDHLAQSNLSALNGQMAQYMIRYCCGDEELMRSNGMSEAEIRKAKAAWEKVLAEYNSVYNSLKGVETYEIAQDGGGEIAGQDTQTLALSSEGRPGDTNTAQDTAVSTAETSQNTAAEVTALSDSDMQNAASNELRSDQEQPTVHSLLMETDASKVKNATERKYLKEYQQTATRQLAEQQKLDKLQAELDALPKENRQTSRARFLRDEIIKTKNRLQICQSIQTRLETDSPLTYLITRDIKPWVAEVQKNATQQTKAKTTALPFVQNGEAELAIGNDKERRGKQHTRLAQMGFRQQDGRGNTHDLDITPTTRENDWSLASAQNVSNEEKRQCVLYAKEHGVRIVGLKGFDGDIAILKTSIDALSALAKEFPTKKGVCLKVSVLGDTDFAITYNKTIVLNTKALRDRSVTEQNVTGTFFASTCVEDIVRHEYGHVWENCYGKKGLDFAKKALYNISEDNVFENPEDIPSKTVLDYLEKEISKYATVVTPGSKPREIVAEVFAARSNNHSEFISEFIAEMRRYYEKI